MGIADLIARQRGWFSRGESRPLPFRRDALRRLRTALARERPALLDALYGDLRKSPHDAIASEIAFVLAEIDFALRNLKRWTRPRRLPAPLLAWPATARIQAEPLGLALVLGPWNYPVQLCLVPLVGALAAGCCAVLKPSEVAARTSAVLAKMVGEAFPPEHVAAVEGGREVSETLLRERFDTVFFTGGVEAGRAVMAAAARHPTPVTLELGGKCPCVVTADANVELAAGRIAWGKMLNAGQTCVAPDYVLVDRRCRERLVEALRGALVRLFGPDPQKSPRFGRIVNRRHFNRVASYLGYGTVIHGGDVDPDDLYIAPTLLADPPDDSPPATEEIFGPVLPVRPVDGLDDAISQIGKSGDPLAAYLFTGSRAAEERFVASVRTGGVCVNDVAVQTFGRHLPFGGVGTSGIGRYRGKASFDAFSNTKTVVRGSRRIDLPWRSAQPTMDAGSFERLMTFLLRR